MNYTDLLPIETPIELILVADRKDYFFETLPVKWRKEYVDRKSTGFYSSTVEDIIQFMKQKEYNVDQEDKQKRKKNNN